ncbi:MAG: PA14 domain-containing protein [Candidatus Brocadiaceae bacterium]|nr:PA14 domain-containing protein [Candidatus Brocadiaceae bacterium]
MLLLGGIYAGFRLLLPVHGLTGYYLSFPEKRKNSIVNPIRISTAELRQGLKKRVYKGYPKKKLIEETIEDTPVNFVWHTENNKRYDSPFTIEWFGLLKIEQSGNYTFLLSSDDGSELYMNGTKIIDNWGIHGNTEKQQTVFLKPGFYRFHARYFDQSGGAIFNLKWKSPHKKEELISSGQFYHEKETKAPEAVDYEIPYTLEIKPHETINDQNIVFKKLDRTLGFTNQGILRTYYVNYWDNDRFEPPGDSPDFNIIWKGFLWIPKEGDYTFDIDTDGSAILFVGEEGFTRTYRSRNVSKEQMYLKKGFQPVQLNFFSTSRLAKLTILWKKPGESKFTGISQRFFKPAEDLGMFSGIRIWCAIGFIMVPIVIVAGTLFSTRRTIKSFIRSYFVYGKQNWPTVAIPVIIILGAILRLDNYSVIPPHGDTMDVYQEAWNGFNILHGNGPKSWEGAYFVKAYKQEYLQYIRWFGDGFPIVKHYIAHPPLFSIFAAIPPIICGADEFLDCRMTTINLTPIFFSTLTIFIIYIVSYKIYQSYMLSIMASLIYATVPLFVAGGRIAKGDCLLSFVLLLGVLFVLKYVETQKKTYFLLAGFLAGVSFWSKEIGICAVVIIPLLLGKKGFIKEAFIAAGIGVFIASNYMLYNFLIDKEVFFKVMELRGKFQDTVFNMVVTYLKDPRITLNHAAFGNGYLLWFWIVLVYSIGKRDLVVPITAFIFLMSICALSSGNLPFGWFLIPLYPFMAIAGAVFLKDFISKPNTAMAIFILLLLFAVPVKEILPKDLHTIPWLYRYYLGAGILPFLAFDFLNNRITSGIAKVSSYIYISFFIIMNVYIVYRLPDLYNPRV